MKSTSLLSLYTFLIFISLSCNSSFIESENDNTQLIYEDSLRRVEKEKKEQEQLENFFQYYHIADSLQTKRKWKKAAFYLDTALTFSTENGEDSLIKKRANIHFKARQYNLAIQDYSTLIDHSVNYSENLYNRALCYHKQKKNQLAVNDLKRSIERGNKDAEELHEKVNPLRKRIAYYVTRCWDGSTSNAQGRGACSHHGGVKNWNEPVYETYRKY